MICPRCGSSMEDGQKFCSTCGAQMTPPQTPQQAQQQSQPYQQQAQQQSQPYQQQEQQQSQPYQQQQYSQPMNHIPYNENQPEKPEKKKKGVLIIVLAIVGALVFLTIAFVAIRAIGSSFKNKKVNTKKTVKEKVVEPEEIEYVDDIMAVATSPDNYAGKYIEFGGFVFSAIDTTGDVYNVEVYLDEDYNNSVLLKVPKDLIPDWDIAYGDFIYADAKIEGEADEDYYASGKALLTAQSIEKTTYQEIFAKSNTTWEFTDKVIEQNGVQVSITKVEFADKETRVYVNVVNNSGDIFNLQDYSSVITQNGSQYEPTYDYSYIADYPQLPYEIRSGITADGVIVFSAMEAEPFQLHVDGYSDNWDLEFNEFVFDIAQ